MLQVVNELKIGTKLWHFHENHRYYEYDDGTKSIGAIYEKKFKQVEITGETTKSWIIGRDTKIPKKNPFDAITHRGFSQGKYFTDELKEEHLWDVEHRRKIVKEVERLSTSTLKVIAQIIGYKENG